MDVQNNKLVIVAAKTVRSGWAESFEEMAANGDDGEIMEGVFATEWGETEWQW